MKNIIILEDSSINDLGGGQRVTLHAISVFSKNPKLNIAVYDLGSGVKFTKLVNLQKVYLRSFGLKGKWQFALKFPYIIIEILKQVQKKNTVIYATTNKALIISVLMKFFNFKLPVVFHQHARSSFLIDMLKLFAKKVIFPGESNKKDSEKNIVIQNPVVIKKIKNFNIKKNTPLTIGFIGSLTEDKGFHFFLNFKDSKEFKVKVAGVGELFKGIPISPDFEYMGYLNEEEKLQFFKGIDILIFPSIVAEPFSLVCFEALFNYIPVVCFDLGYPSVIVKKFNVGVVAKNTDFPSLLEALKECELNLNLLSKNCHRIIEEFDNDNFEQGLLRIFKDI